MKKILLFLFLIFSLVVLIGCSNNTTEPTNTTQAESTPLNQNDLLDSISNAIKEAFE